MPAPKTHKVNPISLAETICGLLAAVPGARTAFLELLPQTLDRRLWPLLTRRRGIRE